MNPPHVISGIDYRSVLILSLEKFMHTGNQVHGKFPRKKSKRSTVVILLKWKGVPQVLGFLRETFCSSSFSPDTTLTISLFSSSSGKTLKYAVSCVYHFSLCDTVARCTCHKGIVRRSARLPTSKNLEGNKIARACLTNVNFIII